MGAFPWTWKADGEMFLQNAGRLLRGVGHLLNAIAFQQANSFSSSWRNYATSVNNNSNER